MFIYRYVYAKRRKIIAVFKEVYLNNGKLLRHSEAGIIVPLLDEILEEIEIRIGAYFYFDRRVSECFKRIHRHLLGLRWLKYIAGWTLLFINREKFLNTLFGFFYFEYGEIYSTSNNVFDEDCTKWLRLPRNNGNNWCSKHKHSFEIYFTV